MIPVNYAKILGGVLVVIAIVTVVLFLRSCGAASVKQEAAQAKTGQAVAEGTAGAARDATAITGNTLDDVAAVDKQTEKNHDAIQAGDGGYDTALRARCLRRAYLHEPRCVALQHPDPVAAK